MDKLKNLLHPGGKKDDEVMYGDEETRRASVGNSGKAPQQDIPTLHTKDEAHKNDHSIMRQVLNPGDDKYDEQRYGSTATTQPPDPSQMRTHPEHQKDHTVLGQILNPNNEKYDERMFQETGATGGDRKGSVTAHPTPAAIPQDSELKTAPGEKKKEHTILRQILNPHGDKFDDQAFGQNATVAGDSSSAAGPSSMAPGAAAAHPVHRDAQSSQIQSSSAAAGTTLHSPGSPGSCLSVKSGVEGPYAREADASIAGSGTSSTLPDRSVQQSTMGDNSHLGRDAAVVGGAGAAGAGAYEASKHHQPQETRQETRGPTTTTTTTTTTSTSGPPTQQSRVAQPQTTQDSNLGRDAAIAGGVGAAGAGAYGASQHRSPHEERRDFAAAGVPGASSTSHGAAGRAPEDQGVRTAYDDSSHLGRNTAIAGGLAGAGAAGAYGVSQHNRQADDASKITDRSHPLGGTTGGAHVNPINPPEDAARLAGADPGHSDVGREAALAGGLTGVGAAGAGAYSGAQHNNLQNDPNTKITDRPHPLQGQGVGAHINPVNQPETAGAGATSAHGSHLGRDAALAGGAGLAGGAAASQLGHQSGPIGGSGPGTYGTANDQAMGLGPVDGRSTTQQTTTNTAAPPEQINQAPADVQNATYTARQYPLAEGIHHIQGPHVTDTANRLDPHVPGEFPTETGEDRHGLESRDWTDVGNSRPSSSQVPDQTSQHTGRDAALAGGLVGAGAGGAAAYGLSNRDASGQASQQTSAATGHPGGQNYPTQAGVSTGSVTGGQSSSTQRAGTTGPTTSTTGQTGTQQHHYGRDAALAGGAGAAGFGAYELGRNQHDNVASPDTGRLHERNVAGVDPTTQREADQLKSGSGSGQAYSTTAQSGLNYPTQTGTSTEPATSTAGQTDTQQHHYGRDAAVAGEAGAAGVGAYELAKDRNEPSTHTGPHDTKVANASDSRVQNQPENLKSVNKPNEPSIAGQSTQSTSQQQQQQHYGRDAAVAGGAGAVGAGAYENMKEVQQPSTAASGRDPRTDAYNQQSQDPATQAARTAGKEHSDGRGYADKVHDDKQEKKLQKKREEEEEKEKKPSLIQRILHPGKKHDDEKEEKTHPEGSGSNLAGLSDDNRVSEDDRGRHHLHKKAVEQPQGSEGRTIDPHTGLPINTEKYGSGAGGTDGSQTIGGAHPYDGSVAGPDWNAIKKANTPY